MNLEKSFNSADVVVFAKPVNAQYLNTYNNSTWVEDKGTWVKKTYATQSQRTQFLTIKSWKGEHNKMFTTEIDVECCKCGVNFYLNKCYILYLYGPNKDGYYSTSSCTRTKMEVKEKT